MAPYAGSRATTLLVAVGTLTSNLLSALFFYQLPDDPYHLVKYFGWYLHLANLLSVFGFVGALRQHGPSVAIFANYLILDMLLSSIPRVIILFSVTSFSSSLCQPSAFPSNAQQHAHSLPSPAADPSSPFLYALAPITPPPSEFLSPSDFSPESCMRTVYLGQLMLGAGVVLATVLQLVGALCVRGYARALWAREMREEEAATDMGSSGRGEGEWAGVRFSDHDGGKGLMLKL
ncbi:hypothetical protein QTJ16_005879 [Diplocarpon rosae]|uniref:Uncharacterized protein n=1 Tax=Diplocarpon rosae TaxID=946125 RepID=A0AAD9SWB7_9HELO|nr:hypothetical protein QTJ16_005879 [Diplocarpon rosae]